MQTIVYIPGVWDLLHVGHVRVLRRARALGDRLVVGVPSDDVVEEDKGKQPVIPLEHRVEMLESLACVDTAWPYYDLGFLRHLELLRPDILAVGETWGVAPRHRDAERWVKKNGVRLVKLPYTTGVSTTSIRSKKGESK